jgi:hypothetical protein
MTNFTEPQITWLQTAVGRRGEFVQAAAHEEEKSQALQEILGNVDQLSAELVAAQDFSIEWTETQRKHFWSKTATETRVVATMAWSTGDRDSEVDTRHDLRDGYQVDPDKAREVQKMHQKLVELQTKMEAAVDSEGNPLFTARDIERELWSPLVKANVIPSNAVADQYSQEAQVFNGACEIYGEQLKQHSKTASKHEKLQRGLMIAKDTVALMGSVASAAISIANFDGASMSQSEKNELADLKKQDSDNTMPADKQARLDDLKAQDQSGKEAKRQQAYATLAFGLANGAFDLANKALDKPSEKRNWEIAELAFNVVAQAAIASISSDQAERNANDKGTAALQSYKQGTDVAKKVISASLAGSKMVFRIKDLLDAPPSGRDGIAKALVATLADAIGNGLGALDVPKGKDEHGQTVDGTNGQWSKIGAYVAAAIVGAANIAQIVKLVHAAGQPDSNKKIDPAALMAAIGLNVVEGIMIGTYEPASAGVRETVGNDQHSTAPLQETTAMETSRLAATGKDIGDMTKALQGANSLFAAFPVSQTIDPDKMQAKLAQANADLEAQAREEDFASYQKRMNEDEAFKAELLADIAQETEERQVELMKLIEDATPSPDDLADQEKAQKAMAAMDKLIAEAEAVKMKWMVIDQLSSGATTILVKFLPGASLAAAIRQLAMDVAYLVKKSDELNLWLTNTALTYGNDSVYGPAISSRVASAKIQVSQKTLDTITSLTGVVMESLRLADITGVATAGTIANSMARALTNYGYKMQKEAAVAEGWALYKQARLPENKGDRKLARKAMRWNSTLSKCVLAYGIVKDGDPIAKEVARNCGLTPEILQDQSDVCQKVVSYFMSVYSDDPVVLHRIPIAKPWHPGTPEVTLTSWIRFKAAASAKAVPPLSKDSAKTPAVDKHFARLTELCGGGPGYGAKRDAEFPANDSVIRRSEAYGSFLNEALAAAEGLVTTLDGYVPLNGAPPAEEGESWTENAQHKDMTAIVESFRALAILLRSEIKFDQAERKVLLETEEEAAAIDLANLFEAEEEAAA